MSDQPKQLQNAYVTVKTLNSTGPINAMAVVMLNSTGGVVDGGAGGGSTQVSIKEILTPDGDSVMDEVNNAINVNVVAGAAAGSTLVTVRQSTYTDFNALVRFADRDQSTQVANVTNTTPASTAYGLVVRQAVAPSTTVNVSSLGGAVIVRSSAANALVTVYQSTAADFAASVVQGSTVWPVQVSSVAGKVLVDQNSTVWPVQVSSVAGRVSLAAQHASEGIVNVADSTNSAIRVNVVAGAAGGSTDVSITQLRDSSGGSVSAGDSENSAIRVNVVAGAAAGSTYVSVRQSTAADLNAAVVQGSTNWPVQVSTVQGAVIVRSSAANALVSVYQSTAADLNVTVAGYSTTVNVSSLGGAVIMRSSAANALMTAYQSTAADLQVTASQNSTAWSVLSRVTTSSGGGVEGSTVTPAANVTGLHVRQVYPTMQSTTVVITSTHSTAIYPVISSVAGLRHKVFAYFIGSTHTSPSTLIFCSSASASGFDHWAVNFGSGSSGITGANLAIAPPGFIFAGISQNALNVKVEGGSSATSTVVVRVALSWFDEA